MTWDEMVEIEPKLGGMLNEAKRIDGSGKHFCANATWYELFKPRLVKLVGFNSKNLHLSSSKCYDIAYQKIYSVLPPCKDCICL